ncbi:MAG: cell division protein SepF [archaeon]|nr:cell division protein SepF [archaeon]
MGFTDNLKKSLGFEEEYGNNFGSVSPKQSYEYDYGLDIGSEFEEEFLDDFTISPEQSFYEIILIKPKSMDDMDYVFDQIVEEKNPVILDLTFLQKKGINEFRQAGERLKILREQYKAEAILLSQVKNLIIVTPARVKLVKKD